MCLKMSKSQSQISRPVLKDLSRLQVSLQSTLRVSSSPVTEFDVQNRAPFPSDEDARKVSFCIASVWNRPCQNLHALTHSFKKLPMGCIVISVIESDLSE